MHAGCQAAVAKAAAEEEAPLSLLVLACLHLAAALQPLLMRAVAMAAAQEGAPVGLLVLGCLQLAAALQPLLMGAVAMAAVPEAFVVLKLAEKVGLQLVAALVVVHLAFQLGGCWHLEGERT